MKTKAQKTTVGEYLVKRLKQAGVNHIFGVPGDYVLGFFDCLENSDIKVINTCNELNAGYAADAYARVNGIGAACVTFGVGGFSIFNAAVGSFAERVPVVIICGSPRVSEYRHHHLLHHTIGDMNLQYHIYEKIAAKSVVLLNPESAPQDIDNAIATCMCLRRPVYIEIPGDIVAKPCAAPGSFEVNTTIPSDKNVLKEAVDKSARLLKSAKKVVVLAGIEAHRLGIRQELEDLINHLGCPFVTTLLGKTVLPEKNPLFLGVYCGSLLREAAQKAVKEANVVLSLGALMTDINLGVGTLKIDPSRMIASNSDNVRIMRHLYEDVSLKDFIKELRKKLPAGKPDFSKIDHPSRLLKKDFHPVPKNKITISRFYERINHFINKNKDSIVLTDTGDSIFCTAELFLPEGIEYIGQAFYLSIGYSVPAALGLKLAMPRRRPVVFVGDGAFQMTAQELSSIIRHKLNPVIFLMNNDGYTIERAIHDGPYNDINMWKYHRLPDIFGGACGMEVRTEGDLEAAIKKAEDNPDSLAFIEVCLDRLDSSGALKKIGKALNNQSVNPGRF
ncbi:MAG: thiamine pyrophosphate-binding protein [Candidatus Omnitrophota bacterium]